MALTRLQANIVKLLAANRSDTSYVAGGRVLNRNWPRKSDDVAIFQDTDEEIGAVAHADINALRAAGYRVSIDIDIYGIVEATVSADGQSTLIQWMSEARTRFFPLVRDDEWGARLHQADLAANKIIAAATRTKARDFVDLAMIAERMCPLGPLVLAAAGKPPHFSPVRIIDETRRRSLSVPSEQYDSVKGLPNGWRAADIRQRLISALDAAEVYVMAVPPEATGLLAVNDKAVPVAITSMDQTGMTLRRATSEPEVMPLLPDADAPWTVAA